MAVKGDRPSVVREIISRDLGAADAVVNCTAPCTPKQPGEQISNALAVMAASGWRLCEISVFVTDLCMVNVSQCTCVADYHTHTPLPYTMLHATCISVNLGKK